MKAGRKEAYHSLFLHNSWTNTEQGKPCRKQTEWTGVIERVRGEYRVISYLK